MRAVLLLLALGCHAQLEIESRPVARDLRTDPMALELFGHLEAGHAVRCIVIDGTWRSAYEWPDVTQGQERAW